MQFFVLYKDGVAYYDCPIALKLEKLIEDGEFVAAYFEMHGQWHLLSVVEAKRLVETGSATTVVYDAPPTLKGARQLGEEVVKLVDLSWR